MKPGSFPLIEQRPPPEDDVATSNGTQQSASGNGPQMAGAAEVIGNAADATTPEITDLVRGLGYDPVRICQWVRDNIAFKPYYGVVKGAALTLDERVGNDADTCALLVCMLRQCPTVISAKYVRGESLIPASGTTGTCNIADWFGIDYNEGEISLYIRALGTPAADVYTYIRDGTTWYSWKRWKVSIEMAGQTYRYDPSFKMIQFVAGMDLAAASNYSRSALLTAAGGVVGAHTVESLLRFSFEAEMKRQALTLTQYLRANRSDADMDDLTGGYRTLPTTVPLSGNANDPLLERNLAAPVNLLPEVIFTKLRVRLGGIDKTIYTAELQGKTLWLEMDYNSTLVSPRVVHKNHREVFAGGGRSRWSFFVFDVAA